MFDVVSAYKCNECEEIVAEDSADEGGPLYECGECGFQFTRATSYAGNHQCPDCLKFGRKVSDLGCPECNEGALEPVQALQCECGELATLDEVAGIIEDAKGPTDDSSAF